MCAREALGWGERGCGGGIKKLRGLLGEGFFSRTRIACGSNSANSKAEKKDLDHQPSVPNGTHLVGEETIYLALYLPRNSSE